jgi:hypothetical protein
VCRAENGDEKVCRRCRADLSLLVSVEAQRRRALGAAQSALLAQNAGEALDQAAAAHRLRGAEDSARLLALGHLLARDFDAAFSWHRATKKNPDTTRLPD